MIKLIKFNQGVFYGWKSFKEQFKITHNIQITEDGLCIGSGYVHNLITVNPQTGLIIENPTFSGFIKEYYPQLLNVSPQKSIQALQAPDTFSKSIPVFTYEGSQIIEEQAEEFGYPHPTYSGKMQYENTFFKTKQQALMAAKTNNQAGISLTQEAIKSYQAKLDELNLELKKLLTEQSELNDQK